MSAKLFLLFRRSRRRLCRSFLSAAQPFLPLLVYLSSIAATTFRHIGSSSTRSTFRPAGRYASLLLLLPGPAAAAAASSSSFARRPTSSPSSSAPSPSPPEASDGEEPPGGVLGGIPVLAAATAAAFATAEAVASIELAASTGLEARRESSAEGKCVRSSFPTDTIGKIAKPLLPPICDQLQIVRCGSRLVFPVDIKRVDARQTGESRLAKHPPFPFSRRRCRRCRERE